MPFIPREQFLQLLDNDWALFLQRARQLPPDDLRAYLQQQGYANLTGLLGHVVAWWQDGSQLVQRMRQDPSLRNPDYDVDAFNAQAVARFADMSEAQMVELYESQRQRMLALIRSLSDSEIKDERINTRLYYEIVYHLVEHPVAS